MARHLADRTDVEATFVGVPLPSGLRRLLGVPVPGLARRDADLQALRVQLGQSAVGRRALAGGIDGSDVVHACTHNLALLSAGLLRRRPSVVSVDATDQQNAYRLPYRRPGAGTAATVRLTRRFEERVYASATTVVAWSAWAASSLRDDYGLPEDRLRIVPPGVDLPGETARPDPDRPPRITFVGRSMDRKGGWLLLDVFRRRLRDRAVLTLVTHERVEPEPGVEVRNDVRGGGAELAEILRSSSVLAFPTELDTYGFAVLEAMAAGVPVVASRTAAIPEIVTPGHDGLLVPPGDGGALGDALEAMLVDDARRRAMAAAARATVEARFDAATTTDRLVDVLHDAGPRWRRRSE